MATKPLSITWIDRMGSGDRMGYATFSDGKTYLWSRDVMGSGLYFREAGCTGPVGLNRQASFRSVKRAALVEAALADGG
jgi:hypothetical protein